MDFLDAAPIGASRLLDPIKFSLFCPTFPAWGATSVHRRREGRRREEAGRRDTEERRRRQKRDLLTEPAELDVQGVLTESVCSLGSAPPRGSLKGQTMILYFRTK